MIVGVMIRRRQKAQGDPAHRRRVLTGTSSSTKESLKYSAFPAAQGCAAKISGSTPLIL